MILQVHDEFVLDVPLIEVDKVAPKIEELMNNALPLSVPMEIGLGTGSYWLEAH